MSLVLTVEGVDKTGLLAAGTLDFDRTANYEDRLSCRFFTTAAEFVPKVGQDIQVHDGAEYVWGGIITGVRILKMGRGVGSDKKIAIDVTAGPYKLIATRRTPLISYDQKSAGYIVEQMVDVLASEGITAGTINTGADPVGEFGEYDTSYKNVYEIMDDMANASGYKWYINADKQLMFFRFDLEVNCTEELRESGTFDDFQIEDYFENLDQYANKVFVLGGTDEETGYVAYGMAEDAGEQAARQAIEGGTGVHGVVIKDTNITLSADAQGLAESELEKRKVVPSEIEFTTFTLGAWYPQFKLTVNLPSLGMTADQVYSVNSMQFYDIDGKTLQCRVKAIRRSASSFSGIAPQTGIEYLAKVVSQANAVSGKLTAAGMVATLSQIIKTARGINNEQLVIPAATQTEVARAVLDVSVAPGQTNTAVILGGTINGAPSQDARVTVELFRDNEALKPTYRRTFHGLDDDGLTFTTLVPAPAMASTPFIAKATVDQGTFTIEAADAVLWVLAVGVGVGEAVDYQPKINLSLTVPDMPVIPNPDASVIYVDPVSIDESLTVPDMPTVTESTEV